MRDFLNAILAFIGTTSLTDDEYNSIDQTGIGPVSSYNSQTYVQLANVLIARGAVSSTSNRLKYFFMSKGVEITEVSKARSNILIGGGLW